MQLAPVAVVIPLYNRATTVLHTLASVADQSLPPRQLIVVDDGSTDGSLATVREWISARNLATKVVLVQQKNQGAGAARNRGFAEVADGELVAFLDSDDRWPADFLERAVAALAGDQEAVAATASRAYHRPQRTRLSRHNTQGIAANASIWLMTHDAGISSCTVFRTQAIRQLNGFNPSIPTGQDIELFLRVSRQGRWLHLPGEPVHFYVGFSGKQGEDANLSSKYADRKHRWAQIRERFILGQDGKQVVPERVYRQALARLYHKAGCDYYHLGRIDLAEMCFDKATEYRPFMISNLWRRVRLRMRRQAAAA